MSRHPLRSVSLQSGMTLLACSLVLFGVAMLASASLRLLQDSISLTFSTIDRLLAHRAAEVALKDAASTLAMIPHDLTIVEAQGLHHLGDITGERFAQGGPMQSSAVPEYFLEALPSPSGADPMQSETSFPHRYRVTAKGKGLSESTLFVLQADFETQTCFDEKIELEKDVRNNVQNGVQIGIPNGIQSSVHNDATIPDQRHGTCIPYVRRLAWRMLPAS